MTRCWLKVVSRLLGLCVCVCVCVCECKIVIEYCLLGTCNANAVAGYQFGHRSQKEKGSC